MIYNKCCYYKSLILVLFIVQLIKCDFSDKSEKQLKYDACYKLIQLKAAKEIDHIKELSSQLNQEEINNVLQYTLFECYQNINYYQAEDLDQKDMKDIDISDDTYSDLSNLEKWEELVINKDEGKLQDALIDLQKAYKDIQSGEIKINRYTKKQNQESQKKGKMYSNNKQDENDEFYVPNNNMDKDFELFGFNFSRLSPNLKNLIGISLIFLIFFVIIYGLNWIKNIRGEKEKNKKKKKKDKKN